MDQFMDGSMQTNINVLTIWKLLSSLLLKQSPCYINQYESTIIETIYKETPSLHSVLNNIINDNGRVPNKYVDKINIEKVFQKLNVNVHTSTLYAGCEMVPVNPNKPNGISYWSRIKFNLNPFDKSECDLAEESLSNLNPFLRIPLPHMIFKYGNCREAIELVKNENPVFLYKFDACFNSIQIGKNCIVIQINHIPCIKCIDYAGQISRCLVIDINLIRTAKLAFERKRHLFDAIIVYYEFQDEIIEDWIQNLGLYRTMVIND